ncbi:hypothetical protein O7632_28120 [Solwaraspora sp. WMMD406]|uniref:hypothetical protein n=1 Tax=Solwaraspora sp. WMMD406 TaxID=3016095 RepID=UPI00241617DC|nr:hypothetical protein [Solwaraspora sp. WMMD406]MDG4767930.1 hypothetical protein [Solwaraspora sp. WMMD406]
MTRRGIDRPAAAAAGPPAPDEHPDHVRVARHRTVAAHLAALDDDELATLLAGATPGDTGMGGATATMSVAGVPVFVKRVPLTELEQRPGNVGSTRNVFGLPTFYQYGFGSTGFGAWRELAAHQLVSDWVRRGRFAGFPLLYHWRGVSRPAVASTQMPLWTPSPLSTPEAIDTWVRRWDDSAAVRDRLTAIADASAGIVLFLEHIPYQLDTWLADQAGAGERTGPAERVAAAYDLVDRSLRAGTRFLSTQGFVHFDAHLRNLLTDGRRVYFADFGLAVHCGFELSAEESAFLARHRAYDRCYTATQLTFRLIKGTLGLDWPDSLEYLRTERAAGCPDLPAAARVLVSRDGRIAELMGGFWHRMLRDRTTSYPYGELEAALAAR